MGRVNQEKIKSYLTPLVRAINNIPVSTRLPSFWKAPKGYTVETLKIDGIIVEHLIPDESNGAIVYQLHGGGYTSPFGDMYRNQAVRYSESAGGAEVFSLDYDLAPENKFPIALNQAITVYQWMLEQGYKSQQMIFAGDSAGANLELALSLWCKDHEIPLPRAIVALSPWATMETKYPSRQYNKKNDLILGENGIEKLTLEVEHPSYIENMDATQPYISPLYGDFTGFPETLIQVSTYEVFYDEVIALAEKMKQEGVDVQLSIYEELPHDFLVFLPKTEEAKAAWNEIYEFMHLQLDKKYRFKII